MRSLLLLVILLAGTAIGYPLVNEDTGDVCNALERRVITMAAARERGNSAVVLLSSLQGWFSNGSLAGSAAKQRSPIVPPVLTCGVAYWRTLIDPSQTEAVINELLAAQHKPNAALDDAVQALSAADQAKEAMGALKMPALTGPVKPDATPNYRPGERRDLDRLIGTQH